MQKEGFGNSLSILLALFSISVVTAFPIAHAAEEQTDPYAINLDELEWGPPGGGNGVPLGTQTVRQGVDPKTGGITYYALFPAGTHFDLHWHSYDEFVVVVQGAVTLELGPDTHDLKAGAYVVIPGKMNHSWDVPDGSDVIILVRRAGPADFHFIE